MNKQCKVKSCKNTGKLRLQLCNKHYIRKKKYNSYVLPKKSRNKDNPLYDRWKNMRQRVYNKNHSRYPDWGGRGIKISKLFDDFSTYSDYVMSLPNSLKKGYSLDRIDNNGDYKPGNLRWSTITKQNTNQRVRKDNRIGIKNVYKTYNGKWLVRIQRHNRTIYRKLFNTKTEAIKHRSNICL